MAEIIPLANEDVAEIVDEGTVQLSWRIEQNRKRFARVLTPTQMQHPLIQNILRNSGRQAYLPDPRALFDMLCFKDKYSGQTFAPKMASQQNQGKCNQFKDTVDGIGSRNTFRMEEKCKSLFVDYTMDQTQPRGWLLDICEGKVLRGPFAAAQGRGEATESNTIQTSTANAYDEAINYVSNVPDTNTSAGGFFIATQKYESNNVGPAMNMQGVETGINDNACDRRTVVHSADYVMDNTTTGLSKGCISLSSTTNEEVRNTIAGQGYDRPGQYSGGGLIYVVTPIEKQTIGKNCGRNVLLDAPIPRPRPSRP